MQELNLKLLKYFNSLGEEIFFKNFVKIFVDLPIFIIPLFLLGFWIYYSYVNNKDNNIKNKEKLIVITYGIIVSLIFSLIIQQIIPMDRPETALNTKNLLLKHLPDASFPSDHATVGMAFLFGILFAGYRKFFWIFLLPMVFMVISRVIAGVHWPLDIIAGTFIGLIGSYLIFSHILKIKLVKKLNLTIINLLKYIKL